MKSTEANTSEILACGLLQSPYIDDYNYEEPPCSPGWLGTQTGLEFMPTLPQLSKCLDYICVLSHLDKSALTRTMEVSWTPHGDSRLKKTHRRIILNVCSF